MLRLPLPTRNAPTLSRRDCIAAVGAVGLGAMGLGLTAERADAATESEALEVDYRIGCSGRSLHRLLPTPGKDGKLTIAEFLGLCRQWDCDCVELQDVGFRSTDDEYLYSIKRQAFIDALELSGVSVYTNFLQSGTKALEGELKRIRKWIDRVALLGAPLLVVFPGNKNKKFTIEQAIESVSQGLSELVPYAAERGVLLGIENHGMLVNDASEIIQVVENVGSPWLGVNLDTGNFNNNTYDNITKLVPYAINCHLKADIRDGGKRSPADLARKFAILRSSGYRGHVVLQYELEGDPLTEVPQYLATMRKLASPQI